MEKDRFYGSCHCGAVKFSIPRDIDTDAVRRCDCSLCKRRGAVMLACPIEDVKIEQGAEHLIHYKWNTKVATHHFCSNCGIMTHHQRRTTPEICGINVGCIDELDYRSFQNVPMNNGIELTLVEQQLARVLVARFRDAFAQKSLEYARPLRRYFLWCKFCTMLMILQLCIAAPFRFNSKTLGRTGSQDLPFLNTSEPDVLPRRDVSL